MLGINRKGKLFEIKIRQIMKKKISSLNLPSKYSNPSFEKEI